MTMPTPEFDWTKMSCAYWRECNHAQDLAVRLESRAAQLEELLRYALRIIHQGDGCPGVIGGSCWAMGCAEITAALTGQP